MGVGVPGLNTLDGRMAEMVVVRMGYHHGVDYRNIFNLAGNFGVSFRS